MRLPTTLGAAIALLVNCFCCDSAGPAGGDPSERESKAVRIASAISAPFDRADALVAVAKFCSRNNDATASKRYLEEALRLVGEIKGRTDSKVAAAIARITVQQAIAGDDAGARRSILSVADPRQRDTLRSEVAAATAAADYAGAVATARRIQDSDARQWALTQVAVSAAKRGNRERATALVVAASEPGRSTGLLLVAMALAANGDYDAAAALTDQISNSQVKLRGLCELADARAAAGAVPEAVAHFRQAERILRAEKLRVTSRFFVTQAKVGELATAVAGAGQLQDDDERDRAYKELAGWLAFSGRPQEARTLASEIRNEFERAEALTSIAVGMARSGEAEGAVRAARSIQVQATRCSAFRAIAKALEANGDRAGALSALDAALDAAIASPVEGGTKVLVLVATAASYADSGYSDAARQAFRSAVAETSRYGDVDYRAQLVREIAKRECICGLADDAIAWAERAEPAAIRSSALLGLVEGILDPD
jgi:tetratricopeptide (TPR) repeat protein